MNHAKYFAGIALATLITAGCASDGAMKSDAMADKSTYMSALKDAKSSIKKAKAANYEWRDSGKLLKNAAKAAKKGDYKAALKLVQKAKRQGDIAQAQAEQEKSAGPRL